MGIFIDTSDIKEIAKFHKMGILRGVTTNPSLMSKLGLTGMAGVKKCAIDIAKLVEPLPVSVELFATKKADMIAQAVVPAFTHCHSGSLNQLPPRSLMRMLLSTPPSGLYFMAGRVAGFLSDPGNTRAEIKVSRILSVSFVEAAMENEKRS